MAQGAVSRRRYIGNGQWLRRVVPPPKSALWTRDPDGADPVTILVYFNDSVVEPQTFTLHEQDEAVKCTMWHRALRERPNAEVRAQPWLRLLDVAGQEVDVLKDPIVIPEWQEYDVVDPWGKVVEFDLPKGLVPSTQAFGIARYEVGLFLT